MAVLLFIVLLGHDFDRGDAFMQKIIGHFIQIFHNRQNFQKSWIAKIGTFSMSEDTPSLGLRALNHYD